MVSRVHYFTQARNVWGRSEAPLTVIFSAESIPPRTVARPGGILPLLVILFIVSYGILTMLVYEQGQTIESQRSLIREMLKDSTQLAALKGKIAHDKASAQSHRNAGSGNTTGSDKTTKRPGKSAQTTKVAPGKPAADLDDVRRATHVI